MLVKFTEIPQTFKQSFIPQKQGLAIEKISDNDM